MREKVIQIDFFWVKGMSDDFDYHYYDYGSESRIDYNSSLFFHIPSGPSFARIILVVLLRAGFVLIHIGSVPVNNVNLILLQNIVDFCWVTIVYFLLGTVIAYNGDVNGVVAEGYWIGDVIVDKDEAIIGWSAVVIAAAICTCGIVGRTHTIGYLVTGFLLAGFLQPFLIHWIWTPEGWMREYTLDGRDVKFLDYAGSAIVHLVGGLSGFIGCAILGRRILRLNSIDDASVGSSSPGTVFAGQFLVFIGLQSLSIPNDNTIQHNFYMKLRCNIYINNLLAASSCSLLVVAFHFVFATEEFNHWTVMRCVQAIVSGLVVISAGADNYSPLKAICLGSAGSIVFFLVSRQVFHSALEDYCNIVAIHLVSSILGSLLVPLFNIDDTEEIVLGLTHFSWHLICLITTIAMVSIVMFVAFASLEFFGVLRNRSEYLNHLRANIAAERSGQRPFLQRLFRLRNQDVILQPGSMPNPDQQLAV
ncbi:putative ammonium transporter 1 [Osmia bicornis bicornis]|uniref:putative ammonium transporter 1 n=1 Tax=Osmia bicornis bicornis TaxID=1437191 RepID=UPI001EAF8CD5|nr:putative ammonium transporter 1 [Osmia bicornis bicornis]